MILNGKSLISLTRINRNQREDYQPRKARKNAKVRNVMRKRRKSPSKAVGKYPDFGLDFEKKPEE